MDGGDWDPKNTQIFSSSPGAPTPFHSFHPAEFLFFRKHSSRVICLWIGLERNKSSLTVKVCLQCLHTQKGLSSKEPRDRFSSLAHYYSHVRPQNPVRILRKGGSISADKILQKLTCSRLPPR
ncbi:hypothetical protein AVEN_10235-1 [Araneus ventricosus]|uniref:Uncharacterized protein n=1 Tax=Araneus ventricosus TaxID=182803 RepID=A0A4Y2J6J8_ARAVE|nr:hypothetical protein AVEN_10235-1 [Araneus ventricosus]